MGGGTTLVEGARLGFNMVGNDLNPVAWFVVKNEVASVDSEEVQALLDDIEREVRPQIAPFIACDGPNGEKGKWTHVPTNRVLPSDFDPLSLSPSERREYHYDGPEIIYTFWSKHGPCQVTGCGHRTPIMQSPVIAVKTLTVKHWEHTCSKCGNDFHIEDGSARMAPDVPLFVAPDEYPFSVLDPKKGIICPHCEHSSIIKLDKGKSKKIELTLLIHPEWMAGRSKTNVDGQPLGGSAQDSPEHTKRWNTERAKNIRLLEVRGSLPESVTCPETGVTFNSKTGTVPKRSNYACGSCGTVQDVLTTVKASGKTGPVAGYAVQGYAPKYDASGAPYSGRFFAPFSEKLATQFNKACDEWAERKEGDLSEYWPRQAIPFGFMTGMANGDIREGHGFTHWWTMFNPRQC